MKTKQLLVAFSLMAMVTSCGNKDKEKTGETAGETTKEETPEVKEEKFINPATFDFSKPVSAEKVQASIMFFYETEFQFLVYPYNNKIQSYTTQAYSGPDNADLSIDFTLKAGAEKELAKNTPVVVKGKIGSTNFQRLNIVDAVIVSEGTAVTTVPFDINTHTADKVYDAKIVRPALMSWDAKGIIIEGFYQMYTESKGGSGNILERRVDVGPSGSKVIGCSFNDNPGVGDKLSSGVDNVKVKGTISSQLRYGAPYMENCTIEK